MGGVEGRNECTAKEILQFFIRISRPGDGSVAKKNLLILVTGVQIPRTHLVGLLKAVSDIHIHTRLPMVTQ